MHARVERAGTEIDQMFARLPASQSLVSAAAAIRVGPTLAAGHSRAKAFSLIELVIVIVIIAIIGAIAIPRMSRGAAGAADSALIQDLSVLRSALDLYQTENNGVYPTAASLPTALLQYNDGAGAAATYSATRDATHIFGPYLRAVPPLPVGARKGGTTIATADAPGVGWIYTELSGAINANTTTEADARGVPYNTY
jgi:general secretion pathway protein G